MPQHLFTPITLRSLTFKNRIFVSPMCQYSSDDGMPNDWHMVHLGCRAVGGAACIIQEATAVLPEGRITPTDAGIWNDAQAAAYRPITHFMKQNGAIPAIQLAHAGRKASVQQPWLPQIAAPHANGGWETLAPSAIPFSNKHAKPREMTLDDIAALVSAFVKAAERSVVAGFEIVEIHAAHGYLLHEFLSPLSNHRTDHYGNSLENRMRLLLEICGAVRNVWPKHLPIFVRISASDWMEGGWDITQSVVLCQKLNEMGIDLIDVSSGGLVPEARVKTGPGYQVPFSEQIRRETGIKTGAVGMITEAQQAEDILASGRADIVLLARELLRDPYWPLHAAKKLGVDITWPKQYERAN